MSLEEFKARRASPYFWWDQANVLRGASDALWRAYEGAVDAYKKQAVLEGRRPEDWIADMEDPAPRFFFIGYLLSAAAMETMLKGALISADGGADVERYGHDLPKLARAAGLQLSPDEVLLLDELREMILWRAKYPAPKIGPKWPLPGVTERLTPEHRSAIAALLTRCEEAYESAFASMLQRDADEEGLT